MLDASVRDRLIAETKGNPLALLELPRGLSPSQMADGLDLFGHHTLSGHLEEGFERRLHAFPPDTRRLLQLAAAEPLGDPVLLWRAADRIGVAPGAAAPAEDDGLLRIGPRVAFRHPLVRSAVYRSTPTEDRHARHTSHWHRLRTQGPIRTGTRGISLRQLRDRTKASRRSWSSQRAGLRRRVAGWPRRQRSSLDRRRSRLIRRGGLIGHSRPPTQACRRPMSTRRRPYSRLRKRDRQESCNGLVLDTLRALSGLLAESRQRRVAVAAERGATAGVAGPAARLGHLP